MHLLVIVGIIIIDERGQEACGARMRKGIGGRGLEFVVEGFPFLQEGGGQYHILLRMRNEDVFVIVIE